jgi:hypothetical protein
VTVTLQYVAGHHAHDKLIQYFSHGWPTHVDVVWPPSIPGGPDRLFGARLYGGVAIRQFDYEEFAKVARVMLPMTAEQEAKFFAFCKLQMGKPYDVLDIAAFAVGYRRDWRDTDKWFCSELVEAAVEASGFYRRIASPTNFVTPSDSLNLSSAFAEVIYVR